MSFNLQPAELLQYLPTYKVVVCASCRYAVQPSAISRHLKDIHHIRRSHRRPFMQYVSQLSLNKPEEVILQGGNHGFPVPLLPVQDGLQCAHGDCQHLCVSVQRMKSHWILVHGRPGQVIFDWHDVPLQTFFKGNLLRYFTNASSRTSPVDHIVDFACQNNAKNQHIIPLSDDEISQYSKARDAPLQALPLSSEIMHRNFFDEDDSALLYHYKRYTSLTIATDAKTRKLWQMTVPQLASQFPFLMHGILACAELHRAYMNPAQQHEQIIKANSHQDIAMPLFRHAITNVNDENCDAVFAFSHLLVIYSFIAEKQDESLLLVEANGLEVLPSWLYFLRGGCSLLCHVWDSLLSGPVEPLASAWEIPLKVSGDERTPLMDHLLSVMPSQVSQHAWSEDVCKIYRDAAIELGCAFSCTRELGETFTAWDALRIWPMRISVDYMNLLVDWHPGALILIAHYCILLQRLNNHWYFEGRATRLLSTIMDCLDVSWHHYIRWPLEAIDLEAASKFKQQTGV